MEAPQPISDSRTTRSTVPQAALNDWPAKKDTLGFEPYVDAIADFLAAPATAPPLTMSVEGSWGSGKSSFMRQLAARLEPEDNARDDAEGNGKPARTRKAGNGEEKRGKVVQFNAWRHDHAEELWTAFATVFLETLSSDATWGQKLRANLRLRWDRFDWTSAILPGLRFLLGLALSVWLIYQAVTKLILASPEEASLVLSQIVSASGEPTRIDLTGLYRVVGSTGVVVFLIILLRKLHSALGNPLEVKLKDYMKSPGYRDHTAFLEHFQKDLEKVINIYAGDARIYVFVDDLDRASLEKSADLMQAINLMISESSGLVFILGLDRAKIAAGIGARYATYLPYLYLDDKKDGVVAARRARDFGYEFIEKFVQLPFGLPQPSLEDIQRMLGQVETPREGPPAAYTRIVEIVSGKKDSEEVLEAALMVAPLFDHNPRRVKQFLNLLRLKAHICAATGLFDHDEAGGGYWPLTIPRLGKFVAITLRWPLLIEELEDNPKLLDRIDDYARKGLEPPPPPPGPHGEADEGNEIERARFWAGQEGMAELLKAGVKEADWESEARYSLFSLNVERLLETSPPVTGTGSGYETPSTGFVEEAMTETAGPAQSGSVESASAP